MRFLPILALAISLMGQTSSFPGSIDSGATLGVPADNVSSALTSPMTTASTTVANAVGFTQWGLVNFGAETVQVCSISGNVLSIGTPSVCPSLSGRGLSGTTIAAHNIGVTGSMLTNAYYHQAVAAAVIAAQSRPFGSYYATSTATFQSAVSAANTAGGGTVILPAASGTVVSLTSTVSLGANVAVIGNTGTLVKAGAGSIALLTATGANVSVTGVNFSASSQPRVVGISCNGCSSLSATWNSFTGNNTYSTGMQDIVLNSGAANGAVYMAHNQHLNTYQGDVCYQSSSCTAEYEYFTGLTGDPLWCDVRYGTFTNGGLCSFQHNLGENLQRYGIEFAACGMRWFDFSHNSFWLGSGGDDGITGGADGGNCGSGGDQLDGFVVDSNDIHGYRTATANAGNGIEIFGHDGSVINNKIVGPSLFHCITYGSYNTLYQGNECRGIGELAENGNTTAFATNSGFIGGPYSFHDNTFRDNWCVNVQAGCMVAGSQGDVIEGTHDLRSPGYWPGDSRQRYSAFQITQATSSPYPLYPGVTLRDNYAELTAPSNGFSLGSPGSFTWICVYNASAEHVYPVLLDGFHCANLNATRFGNFLFDNVGYLDFNLWKITNSEFTNLTNLGGAVSRLTESGLQVASNTSLIGAGSGSPAADFLLDNQIPARNPVTPACTSGAGLDGAGGANCSSGFTGAGPHSGSIRLTASGTPAANGLVFTITVPANTYSAAPNCTFTNNYNSSSVNTAIAYDLPGSSATSLKFHNPGSALTAGAVYSGTYACSNGY